MRNKLVYVVPLMHLDTTRSLGVRKKILGQVKAFESMGFDVSLVDAMVRPEPQPQWVYKGYSFIIRLIRYPFKKVYQFVHAWKYKKKSFAKMIEEVRLQDECIVYMRHAFLSPKVFKFYFQVYKSTNVNRVYLEVPTWPYIKESYARSYERLMWPMLRKSADRVVTFGSHEKIFEIPAIRITNGISASEFSVSGKKSAEKDFLQMIVCANLGRWVGLDRLLHGLKFYLETNKNPKNIQVLVVGHGRCFHRWRVLTEKLELSDHVEFKGVVGGEKLDELFSYSELALGNLANHRRNLPSNADLKNREYCARGIPFALSGGDPSFPEDAPFICSVAADESPVDVAALIEFLDQLKSQEPNYQYEMQKFAQENLDWCKVMVPVAEHMALDFMKP